MSKTIGRTFIFEKDLWTKLDDDAKRCLRSSTKQMEAILKTYFGVADVELDKNGLETLGESSESKLEMLGELAPQSKKKMPLIEAVAGKKKKTA